jgi:uncharacterized protein (DUF4415 family)
VSEKDIKTYSLEQIRAMKGQTDWDALSKNGDFEGPDEEDFEVDWSRAVMVENFLKTPISLRVDPDVLEFFKSQGPGYQTRMNAVLRSYMNAKKANKQP